jgi:acylpyruvate hydrolase
MRLITCQHDGRTKVGAWLDDCVVDLSLGYDVLYAQSDTHDTGLPASMLEFLSQGDKSMNRARAVVEKAAVGDLPPAAYINLEEVILLAPVPRPGKILCVDYNYPSFIRGAQRFLEKQGIELPEWDAPRRPWIYGKFSSTVIGTKAAILKSKHTQALDAEGELAAVIGKTGRFIPESEALCYVAGYTLLNDISDRAVEFRPTPSINHRLYTLGKNNDTFCPLGPCLFTLEEIGEPSEHSVEVLVNGEVLYQYAVKEAYYSVASIVSFCSQLFRLDPGDVIATGSAGGCGAFKEPPIYLATGDMVAVQVPGLPALENVIEDEPV